MAYSGDSMNTPPNQSGFATPLPLVIPTTNANVVQPAAVTSGTPPPPASGFIFGQFLALGLANNVTANNDR